MEARRRRRRGGGRCANCGGRRCTAVAAVCSLLQRWSGVEMAAAAAAMVMEGEEKIRVRVLGDEDDDVARSEWSIG